MNDGDGDSITATAPRAPAPIIPLSAPQQVEIRTLGDDALDDDSADETEVKTLAAGIGEIVRNARAAGATEADVADDSVTAQAPVHPASPPQGKSAPVIRIGAKSLVTGAPKPGGKYNPEEEDSVTERGLAVGADYPDDSVTAQSPNGALPEPIDGETEGTTKRVRRKKSADPNASEADAPDDSVTAAAPGHLTNMLRVIASPSDEAEDDEEEDDDDPLGNRTQVMLNAPVKRPPHSESALRMGPDQSGSQAGMSGERASLGMAVLPHHEHHHPGAMRGPMASDAALGPSPSDRISRAPYPPMPMPPDDRKPPYALLVGVVAAVSILIPVILFIVLSQGGGDGDAAPRVTSQPSPDPVGVTGPRPKAGKPGASTTTPRTTGGGPTNNRSPFRR